MSDAGAALVNDLVERLREHPTPLVTHHNARPDPDRCDLCAAALLPEEGIDERAPFMTESEVMLCIARRYASRYGNGPRYVVIPHVRNAAGFDATRTADAVVMGLWPSEGLPILGIEIKVARSDWLREVKKPQKAGGWLESVDYWWIAAADASVVRIGELPTGWGLMVCDGGTMRTVVVAQQLRDPGLARPLPPSLTRSGLAALLRAGIGEATARLAIRATMDERGDA